MKRSSKLSYLIVLAIIVLLLPACAKSASNTENVTGDNNAKGKIAGANEYVSKDYAFSFKYNNLTLDSKIDGNQFAELASASGDKAVVTIVEPDKIYGDNPEEWLLKSYETSENTIENRKILKLGKYNARLVEYSWKVGGKPIRTIDLTAYKDGLYYSLIVTMKEENVKAVRQEFDTVVNSFTLADTVVSLDALKPWKTQLPADYPLNVIDLYGIREIYSVVGKTLQPGKGFIAVQYYPKDQYSAADIGKMFQDSLKDAQNFKYTDVSEEIKITGTKAGYDFKIQISKYSSSGKINMIKIEVSKPK
jgi:hypothetical protein